MIYLHNNKEIFRGPSMDLEVLAADLGVSVSELSIKFEGVEARDYIRKLIFADVADRDSMLGTVADASQMLVLSAVSELIALSDATTFEDYKAKRLQFISELSGGSADPMIEAAAALLGKVKSGEVVMPYLCKPDGAQGVFKDVATRATGVATVLKAVSE